MDHCWMRFQDAVNNAEQENIMIECTCQIKEIDGRLREVLCCQIQVNRSIAI